jgi:extracellular elastinolytic metalloproteinase
MLRFHARQLIVLLIATLAGALTVVPAAGAQARRSAAKPAAAKPFLDVRDAQRRAVERRGDVSLRAPSAGTRSARGKLRSAGAVLDVDALTGTPRLLAGRGAPLSAPASGNRRDVAERYLRGHLAALGLSRTDLGSLQLARRTAIPGGAQLLAYRQYADGIPSFDGGLTVAVDASGRVVSVSGAAQPGLSLKSRVPALTAAQAMRELMDDAGVKGALRTGDAPASLVAFGEGTSARLGWQLDLRAGPGAHYAAVVDAANGRILYRANRVKSAANDALVWDQYPGAPGGGTAHTVDLTPYLNAGATDLSGPFAHAWSDLNDNDTATRPDGHIDPLDAPDLGEAVGHTGTGGSFSFPLQAFTQSAGACDAAHECSWNADVGGSWSTNRAQNAVQAFYFVNRYHDHLLAAPISFTPAGGNFEGSDRLLVNADDGASTGPDINHRDNAYMDTPPDGTKPTMAMFLFVNNGDFRDVNGGDDAEIVYHEYTHGLSNRLITDGPGGEGALNGPQSGGMGEGWSDWYAKDFILDQFPTEDTAAAGDVDMGKYIDSVPHSIRSQGLDCPVGATAPECPGGNNSSHAGGYTYGDFNTTDLDIRTHRHEVHEVGEIWGETLWDLRDAVGSAVAEAIITQGMRLSPPEPTFLDERDAIITADQQLFPDGDHSGAIWGVFATRGMGWDAASPTQDMAVEGFKRPPTAALTPSPSPAIVNQPVTLDASGSTAGDASITSYDFDFQGDGQPDVTGTTNPRQTVTYTSTGTFHPVVTVHDNAGQTDTAARALIVGLPPAATPPGGGGTPPGGGPPAASKKPTIVLARTGKKGRTTFTVTCDSACTGTATLTITRKLAKKLHLGKRRTVGKLKVRLTSAKKKRFTVKLTKKTLKAMKRAGVRRLVTRISVVVTDHEHQRATKGRSARIKR